MTAPDVPAYSRFRSRSRGDHAELRCPLDGCHYTFPASLWEAAQADHADAHSSGEWDALLASLAEGVELNRRAVEKQATEVEAETERIRRWAGR